ncbi:(deoxy)nucleoside triphosphate pyrophosphohydrolase [Parerythrobacter aurantius]|uniref:(deoxy)nucleoside triphosphate pyrophosphohydrolase n=1 Tax=Parerythrobacter aurantius TaxID=3127706 RepID=UPI003250DE49
MLVVAAVLVDGEGRWLLHRRPPDKEHGGLWEFPGGKVEQGEMPTEAIVREMAEETGIDLSRADLDPVGFATSNRRDTRRPIVILLYKVTQWEGDLVSLEGGILEWFEPDAVNALSKPPLDTELVRQLARISA